jgi:hypothetical protein
MTAKELLQKRVPALTEEQAERALLALDAEPASSVDEGNEENDEMAPLPDGWGRMANGQPMPNVVAAVRRSREGH